MTGPDTQQPVTLAQIVAALSVTYSPAGVMIWLNSNNEGLGGLSPQRKIEFGRIDEVADAVRRIGDADPSNFVISDDTQQPKRIGVTGGRDFADHTLVVHALRQMPADATLVHGAAPGADSLCADWWGDIQGRKTDPHPADWDGPCDDRCHPGHRRTILDVGNRCPAKGPLRNQEMVDSGLDVLIAFPGGRGTNDMVRRAERAHIRVIDLRRAQ